MLLLLVLLLVGSDLGPKAKEKVTRPRPSSINAMTKDLGPKANDLDFGLKH